MSQGLRTYMDLRQDEMMSTTSGGGGTWTFLSGGEIRQELTPAQKLENAIRILQASGKWCLAQPVEKKPKPETVWQRWLDAQRRAA